MTYLVTNRQASVKADVTRDTQQQIARKVSERVYVY